MRASFAAVGLIGALLGACPELAAQGPPRIHVAPSITVAAASQSALPIEVGPPGVVPQRSFLSLRGLPPAAALSTGQEIGPGSWVVPVAALPSLSVQIPPGLSGRSDLLISLIAMDGRLLTQAKSTLVIELPAAGPLPERTPAAPPARAAAAAAPPAPEPAPQQAPVVGTPPPAPSVLQGEERARAERLLEHGEVYLADGNIMGARDFFERAADAGLPAAALRMAATYDPAELGRLHAHGVAPDLALARKWYERARALGAPEAAERLTRLRGN